MSPHEVRVVVLERSPEYMAIPRGDPPGSVPPVEPEKPFIACAVRTVVRSKPLRSKVLASAYGATAKGARMALRSKLLQKA